MTKKQIRKHYAALSDAEKVERLEFWAKLYLGWLDVEDPDTALISDVVEHYTAVKAALDTPDYHASFIVNPDDLFEEKK